MDVVVYENGDGGDVYFSGGDLEVTNSLFNQIYLALFGGNVEQTTREAEPQDEESVQRFDWWGNSVLFNDNPEQQFNSLFERALKETPLNSNGRLILESTAKQDLEFMNKIAEIDVQIQLVDTSRARINITFNQPEGIGERLLVFLWDGTRLEDIKHKLVGSQPSTTQLVTQSGDELITQSGDEIII